ncbi:hypothetical protein Vadar_013389 [Vaccinium darrowii]|uniref:Uncharacterized protein n=1 Tax=Vaccinium darrowii TaxID=229202 RepID=A0ACB7YER4_9ERIC|nr:hypothetical protein Vadar_013389 [Vaccinium darrowii]
MQQRTPTSRLARAIVVSVKELEFNESHVLILFLHLLHKIKPTTNLENLDSFYLKLLFTDVVEAQEKVQKLISDLSSPYFLHSADHPRTPLVDVVLTHTNYGSWSRSIDMALCAKNKQCFIDNTLPCPTDPDIIPLWKRVSTMVLSWLLNSISNTITPSLASCRTPYELWRDLESRFTQEKTKVTPTTVQTIQEDSAMFSQKYQYPQPSNGQQRYPHMSRPYAGSQPRQPQSATRNHQSRQPQNTRNHQSGTLKDPNAFCEHCKVSGHYKSGCFKIIGPHHIRPPPNPLPSHTELYPAEPLCPIDQTSTPSEHSPTSTSPTIPPPNPTITSTSSSTPNPTSATEPSPPSAPEPPPPSRPSRTRQPPRHLQDYICPTIPGPTATAASTPAPSPSSGTVHPLSDSGCSAEFFSCYDSISSVTHRFRSSISFSRNSFCSVGSLLFY